MLQVVTLLIVRESCGWVMAVPVMFQAGGAWLRRHFIHTGCGLRAFAGPRTATSSYLHPMYSEFFKTITASFMRSAFVVSLLLGAMFPVFSQAQEVVSDCPPLPELKQSLEQRLGQLNDTRMRLVSFISGNQLADVPPASLFVVDLKNEAAVAKRVEELRIAHESPTQTIVADDRLLQCAVANEVPKDRLEAVIDAQWQVNELRLQFLGLPRERRAALINSQQSFVEQSEAAKALEQERIKAKEVKQQAQQSVVVAEELAKTAVSSAMRELASQRALLEKVRADLASTHMRLTQDLQVRTQYYQETAEKLSSLAGLFTQEQSAAETWEKYQELVLIWRELVDRIFERIADPASYEPLPQLPSQPTALLARLPDDEQARQYALAYGETATQYRNLSELRSTRFASERENLYRLLLQAGKLRSQLLQLNVEHGDGRAVRISEEYFGDVGREVRVVPYHLLATFYTKILDFRRQASSGLEGWFYIAKQSMLLIIALAFPFVVYYLLRRFSEYLSRLRRALVRGEIRSKHSKALAIWIQRLNHYVPWVVMLLGLGALDRMVADTVFAELRVILPYLAYYFWYRIFLLLLFSLVGVVAHSGAVEVGPAEKERIGKVARQVGIFFVTALAILHATEDVVGKALVYRFVSDVMFYVGTAVCAFAAWQWRMEIAVAGEKVLPKPLAVRMPQIQSGWRAWLFSLPALLLVIAARAVEYLTEWAGEFDFFKRIGAELFRRRIEGSEGGAVDAKAAQAQSAALPEDYLRWFELEKLAQPDVFIIPDNDVVEQVKNVVQAWSEEQAGEHSIVLYGDKGGGKTTLLQIIKNSVSSVAVHSMTVPPKLSSRAAVMQFFGTELGVDLSSGTDALLRADAAMPKTMITVDEAHNLFLAKLGGFEGYRAFVELVNLPTTNLFWCATINRRSWKYLCGVFGGSQQFRKVISVPSFSDADIQKLIMTRHRKTPYRLAYDEIIRATQSEDDHIGVTAVETQFFRLLWGQSNGNPRAAMALWLASLRRMPGNKLRVGVPRYQPVKGLEKAGDDAWFVYAAILRHENISVHEVMQTTNLSEGVVRSAIKIGVEARALAENVTGRFHVTPNAQFYLNQLLARKNFIHE